MMSLAREEGADTGLPMPGPSRPLPPPALEKLTSWDLYRAIGSPRLVVAPMVDASELAWRILSRLHGAQLCYTPMIHAAMFASEKNERYRNDQFDIDSAEEGEAALDRPLFAQFCANDADVFLQAALQIAASGRVDAIDLNLGCPQGIAKRGHYGAFLMEDWSLIERLIHHLHTHLPVPVTAKFRVYDDVDTTVAYARMLERAGAQIIACHGRTRDQKGQRTGLADWRKIRAIKEAVRIPVFANGNILTHEDVSRCLLETGADGVMSAEGNLYNPALYAPIAPARQIADYRAALPATMRQSLDRIPTDDDRANPRIVDMCRRYLAIVSTLRTKTAMSAVKGHLFKLLMPIFTAGAHLDLRAKLGSTGADRDHDGTHRIADVVAIVEELARRFNVEGEPATIDTKVPWHRLHYHLRPIAVDPEHGADPLIAVTNLQSEKRGSTFEHATDAPVSKMCRASGCPGCHQSNLGAVDCVDGARCFTCCRAGIACEPHERKRSKLREKEARAKEKQAARRRSKKGSA